jgi:hypothetical protein
MRRRSCLGFSITRSAPDLIKDIFQAFLSRLPTEETNSEYGQILFCCSCRQHIAHDISNISDTNTTFSSRSLPSPPAQDYPHLILASGKLHPVYQNCHTKLGSASDKTEIYKILKQVQDDIFFEYLLIGLDENSQI